MTFAGVTTAIDTLNRSIGRVTAWLTLAMVLVIFCVVVLRYLFDTGWIWLQESVTWMHAAVFMLGAAYTLQDDGHVREPIVAYYEERARGGAGLVITEVAAIAYPRGATTRRQIALSDDCYLPGLQELTRRANELVVTEYRPLELYSLLILEYLVLVLIISAGVRWLERRMGSDERG